MPGELTQGFAHNEADRLVGLTDVPNSALSQTLQYDVLDCLTNATNSFGAAAFSYTAHSVSLRHKAPTASRP
ncbi:MAG: hypothetical protein Q8J78_09380 [Moraxellaceae bacterium]|nr:hypothetical protein [Moraxellaceae bacterium]